MEEDYKLLTEPYTVKQLKVLADDNNFVSGVVPVDLADILDNEGFEWFLDHLSLLLTGTELLMDFNYEVVGFEPNVNVLHIKVEGDVSMILEDIC